METTRIISQEFEERKLRFDNQAIFCWFTAKVKISTDIDDENQSDSWFEWIDIIGFEYANSLQDANEGLYYTPSLKMIKSLELDLQIDEFRF